MITNKRHHSQRHPQFVSKHCIVSRRILLTASLLIHHLPKNASSFSLPSPSSTPPLTGEHIVQTQLSHYKTCNLPEAFKLCSPWFQESMGTLSGFEDSLNQSPYNLLLGHERADILLETIPDGTSDNKDEGGRTEAACYLVCIKPGKGAQSRYPVWFWWEVSRHYFDEEELEDEDAEGEWRVDCVMPDFDDLEFEAESLAQFINGGEDQEGGGLLDFFMDFAEDDEDDEYDDDDEYD